MISKKLKGSYSINCLDLTYKPLKKSITNKKQIISKKSKGSYSNNCLDLTYKSLKKSIADKNN